MLLKLDDLVWKLQMEAKGRRRGVRDRCSVSAQTPYYACSELSGCEHWAEAVQRSKSDFMITLEQHLRYKASAFNTD